MGKKEMCMLLAAVLAVTALVTCQFLFSTVATGSWGLSFRTEGVAPIGPAGSDQLAKYDAAYIGDTTQPVLYLTFDAGYENGCTAKILDILKKHNVPAAFFLVGNYMEKNPDLVRRMVEEGHIVGNHTMHHPDMSKLSTIEKFSEELTALEALFKQITGQELPKYYRPPQGTFSQENLVMAKKLGYKTVFWSLAYVDWNVDDQPTAQQAFDKLIPRIHNGAVVLLHSTSATNAAILDELLTKWEAMGYRFESIEALFPADG